MLYLFITEFEQVLTLWASELLSPSIFCEILQCPEFLLRFSYNFKFFEKLHRPFKCDIWLEQIRSFRIHGHKTSLLDHKAWLWKYSTHGFSEPFDISKVTPYSTIPDRPLDLTFRINWILIKTVIYQYRKESFQILEVGWQRFARFARFIKKYSSSEGIPVRVVSLAYSSA